MNIKEKKRSITPSPAHKEHPKRRFIKRLVITFLTLIILAGVALGGTGFYLSNLVLEVDHSPTNGLPIIPITAVTANTVTLQRTSSSQKPGVFELDWSTGQAIVGPIQSSTTSTVTRKLLQATAPLTASTKTYWNRDVYSGKFKDSLGLTINDVQVPDPLGPMPAWYVPGNLTTWVLMVHGRGVGPEENLRAFKPLAQLGLPILAISYRNDIGSPASPDGWDHLGDTEWQDVEAGARYAVEHGAQHLVLYGWSEGGALVGVFEHRSSYAHYVQALVLDAPVLDWNATLTYQIQKRSFPGFVANVTETIVSLRSGINFDALNHLSPVPLPTLLFQGTNDTTIPVSMSDDFARAHPDFVTYKRIPNAGHTESWNTDPQAYDNDLTLFLTQKLHLVPS